MCADGPSLQITEDRFLGGRLTIRQPAKGYRAGSDPVILAAAVPAHSGQSVLDLGCGVGTAALCLAARVPGIAVTGVELQAEYADLARENAVRNVMPMNVVTADLRNLPSELHQMRFDHVIANPPYFNADHGTAASDPGRATAFSSATPLVDWVDAGVRRLAPGGRLTVIQRAERLAELLAACDGRIGGIGVLPLAGRPGRDAERIVLQGRKGARAAFRLLAPLVLHGGDSHDRDQGGFSAELEAVLRRGAALPVAIS